MGVCMPRGKRPGALFFLILPHERPPEQGGAEEEAEDGEPREAARQRSDVAQQRAADEQGSGDERGAELQNGILHEARHVVPDVVLDAQIGLALQPRAQNIGHQRGDFQRLVRAGVNRLRIPDDFPAPVDAVQELAAHPR